ncbi:hypothetical protein AAC387_Pa04g1066 [Persea americana]
MTPRGMQRFLSKETSVQPKQEATTPRYDGTYKRTKTKGLGSEKPKRNRKRRRERERKGKAIFLSTKQGLLRASMV